MTSSHSHPRFRSITRRTLLRYTGAAGVLTAIPPIFLSMPAFGQTEPLPQGSGDPERRMLIRGGTVLSMDRAVGDFAQADILVIGKQIAEIGPHLDVDGATIVDATGMVVIPGFIDTHHHLFETALRSLLPDGLLMNDGEAHSAVNYVDTVLTKFAPVYRPEDVYISELVGSLSQLDAGVTTVHDVSQIHHSPEHTDAAIQGLVDSGRRAALGYFDGPLEDARRVARQYFSSSDQLLTMTMGGELHLPDYKAAWSLGRELGIPVAAHVVGVFGMREAFDRLAGEGQFGPDNIFIHMTGMSDLAWRAARDAGASVSLAVPIEMTMRHGMPPIMKMQEMGMRPSLSSDVETTMTADFFTQMRALMTLQRAFANEAAISGERHVPDLLTSCDMLESATIEGAKALHLDDRTGTLTPGKQADIVLLDARALNVMPLNNAPGAVVSLMERSNVDTVMVAGHIRKWRGTLIDADLPKLRREIEASRDHLFEAVGMDQDLFRR